MAPAKRDREAEAVLAAAVLEEWQAWRALAEKRGWLAADGVRYTRKWAREQTIWSEERIEDEYRSGSVLADEDGVLCLCGHKQDVHMEAMGGACGVCRCPEFTGLELS